MRKRRGGRYWALLILLLIPAACLAIWIWWDHPDWFGGDSLYKPLSDCPVDAASVPADAGWSAVVPASAWDGWYVDSQTSSVSAVAVDSKSRIYIAGDFTTNGTLNTAGIVRWDPETRQWTDLGGLLNRGEYINQISLLIDAQDRVYVSGTFSFVGGRIANGIAFWDGQTWSNLQGGVMDGEVNGMALDGRGGIYIAGSFSQVGMLKTAVIAHWNGQTWENPGNLAGKLSDQIHEKPFSLSAIAYDASHRILYASGKYDPASSKTFIAAWSESAAAWSMLLQPNYASVGQLALGPSGELYVAGTGSLAQSSEGIAMYFHGHWTGLRGGLTKMGGSKLEQRDHGITNVPMMYPTSLVVSPKGQVYLAGEFTAVDNQCMYGIAHWNGKEWKPLGSGVSGGGIDFTVRVKSLVFDTSGNLYAAGGFKTVGGKSIRYLARWTP